MDTRAANLDLDSLERSVFRRSLSHGLIDIAIGCVLILPAAGPNVSSAGLGDFWGSAVFLPLWGVAALVLWVVHRRCVAPRLGYVQFAPPRRRRLIAFNVIMLGLGVVALVAGAISCSHFGLLSAQFHGAAVGVFVIAGFALAAHYLELRRLYFYGLLIVAAPLVGELLWKYAGVPHHGFPVTFGLAAGLCMVVGLVLLVRLIVRHPLPPRDANAGGA